MKILTANEKFIEKGGASSDENIESDDEDENFEDEDDANAEEEATLNKLKNFKQGNKIAKSEGSDSDDEDSDYEENAGEFALYDSPLEKTDELLFLKETMETIHNVD